MSMAYSCLTGAAVKITGNHNGEVERAAKEFLGLIPEESKAQSG